MIRFARLRGVREDLSRRDLWEETGGAARWPDPFPWQSLGNLDHAVNWEAGRVPSPDMARMIQRELSERGRP